MIWLIESGYNINKLECKFCYALKYNHYPNVII